MKICLKSIRSCICHKGKFDRLLPDKISLQKKVSNDPQFVHFNHVVMNLASGSVSFGNLKEPIHLDVHAQNNSYNVLKLNNDLIKLSGFRK